MGVDPKAKTYGQANSGVVKGQKAAEFMAAMAPPAEMVGTAVEVLLQLLQERHEADPTSQVAKVSIAKMKGGDWCTSANDWTARVGLSSFAPTAGASICGLAAKLVAGEPWKRLPEQS